MAKRYKYVSKDNRAIIAERHLCGDRPCDIAERLGVHTATIYRELQRGYTGKLDINNRPAYDPDVAQQNIMTAIKQKGRKKLRPAAIDKITPETPEAAIQKENAAIFPAVHPA